MPEMHLKQSSFSYSACGPYAKGKTGYTYKNDLDKACFQPDMTYGKFKDLAKRRLALMVYKFFDKKSTGSNTKMKFNKINNLQMNFTNQLLENLKEEKFINHHLKTIFGV